ncbi:GntR family transcriptional regulator [Bacillus sp. ISL-18]|uniref:GntR family transcriptional regulator n=1 Tax=Bacillus sp. ISL-18 TaxID=2819118 RepID=UPI001BE9A028|nr:GntR family transcriptional regulator [Bacillus sp. ISL-18]
MKIRLFPIYLKVGDQIETEEQLAELFGYSRMTINKALNRLVEKKTNHADFWKRQLCIFLTCYQVIGKSI